MGLKQSTNHCIMSGRITIPVSSYISIGQGYNIISDSFEKSIISFAKSSIRNIDYSHYSSSIVRSRKDIRNFLRIPITKEMQSLGRIKGAGNIENVLKSFKESNKDTQILIKFVYKKHAEFLGHDEDVTIDEKTLSEYQLIQAFLVNYGDHFCVEKIFGGMMVIKISIRHDTMKERELMEKELNLQYSIVNPLVGIEQEVINKIPKEKVNQPFNSHFLDGHLCSLYWS
jgi:hypothetical protein